PGKMLLARAYYLNDNANEAINVLRSIEKPDKDVSALLEIIRSNGNMSVESLEKMLETNPSDSYALGKLCIAARTIDPQKALEYCERALILDKENINHAIGYGAALVQLKRYGAAAAVLTNLLKHSPENYTIHANLATALFQMDNFEAAKNEYSWIIAKEPEIPIAYYFLAISHDRLQEYADALQNYREFRDRADPDDNMLEIEKVDLRIPILIDQIKRGKGKKK
ncbi:MAG: tetratricopeptide repeat protein, partial [Acidobacteria bacterium]|nr:tetratricopeptide repeat protein [Acidobacteriota bacterium]